MVSFSQTCKIVCNREKAVFALIKVVRHNIPHTLRSHEFAPSLSPFLSRITETVLCINSVKFFNVEKKKNDLNFLKKKKKTHTLKMP